MYLDFYIEELPKDRLHLKEGESNNKVIGITFDLNTFDTKEDNYPVTLWINCPTAEYKNGDITFLIKALKKAVGILKILEIRGYNATS